MPNKCFVTVLDAFYVAEVQRAQTAKKKINKFGQSRNAGTDGHSGAESEVTFIGLQVAKHSTHHTTAGKVAAFLNYMTCNFKGWEALREKMKWEIIYIQHAESTPMTGRRDCHVTEGEKEVPRLQVARDFWERKVEQYQVQLDTELAVQLVVAGSADHSG
ncbi:putative retrotransposon hot spot (RHS) protein [Trypanosoma rangeli]|uniref:Putative retrotransposon hot spot (RHS) protein n=1 Tax=Trypanosoma rangeli TaxID=5698 RepID=A0A3R7R520_TRYRA|nr:putative retrotransposon hot spot (RHS) protein [Trypanosoma rangeli]RNE96109.1 putative retrotransposon hot spot (RHS) protein [Trypanosoma rangeli]|eukprot:RNE96109.1 putative retrotransposon hot spot (RHS) protein [Trypanosoma rangeli]